MATFTLTGTLRYHSGVPRVNAHLSILGLTYPDVGIKITFVGSDTVVTDADGFFSIDLQAEPDQVYIVQSRNPKHPIKDPITGAPLRVVVPSQAAGSTHDISEFMSSSSYDVTPSVLTDTVLARDAAIAAAASVAYSTWQPTTAYVTDQTVQAPDGSLIKSDSSRTSGASFDAAEQDNWTTVVEADTLERAALRAAFIVKENTKARYGSPPMGSSADVDRFIAPNGTKLTSIVTYVSDPNNEVVEPSVWYDPNGLFGWEYWMAAGPYKDSDATVENPSVWVSHDGITWQVPPGATNPVVPAPGSGNYDDPHLFEKDGQLHLVWNYSRAGGIGDQILYQYTSDGITWSSPVAILTSSDGTQHEYVSPHIEYQNGVWHLWYLKSVDRTMHHRTATSITGTWSAADTCTVPVPSGKDQWEFEIRRVGSEWWMLQCVVTSGGTSSGGELRFRTSTDGITWNMSRRPVLGGNLLNSSGFDGNFIYKASFVPLADGRMAIWYSAGSGGTLRWAIGYTVAETPRKDRAMSASYFAPPCGVGTTAMTSGTAYYLPIYLDKPISIQSLELEVTVAGSTGSTITLGLYEDTGYGRPGKLIADLGSAAATATGFVTKATSQTLGPGVVWLAALALGAPTTNPTVRSANTPTGVIIATTTKTLASGNALVGHRQTSLAALPALATVDTSIASANIPRPIMQVA